MSVDHPSAATTRAIRAPVRVVARLDVKGPNVIKGVRLEGLRVVGQPATLSRRYAEQGADEILFMDAVASLYERNSILPHISEAARDVFVPLTVGGGIRTITDVREALRAGADKVAINTAAVRSPTLLQAVAERYGSQCVVLSVEAKRHQTLGWEVYTDGGREHTGRPVLAWVEEAVELGAGEVLLTSVDRDGTRQGFDVELVRAVQRVVSVPVIASGGAGRVDHVVQVIQEADAEAVAIGAILHGNTASITGIKQAIQAAGIPCRPPAESVVAC